MAGLIVDGGRAFLSGCSIDNAETALHVIEGTATVDDCKINGNRYGVSAIGPKSSVVLKSTTVATMISESTPSAVPRSCSTTQPLATTEKRISMLPISNSRQLRFLSAQQKTCLSVESTMMRCFWAAQSGKGASSSKGSSECQKEPGWRYFRVRSSNSAEEIQMVMGLAKMD